MHTDSTPADIDGRGADLRAAREHLGLSRPALAKLAGVSAESIENFERGRIPANSKTLVRVLRALAAAAPPRPSPHNPRTVTLAYNETQAARDLERALSSPEAHFLSLMNVLSDKVLRRGLPATQDYFLRSTAEVALDLEGICLTGIGGLLLSQQYAPVDEAVQVEVDAAIVELASAWLRLLAVRA
jgi:transcriptional regulator with XRE-family HTH domain